MAKRKRKFDVISCKRRELKNGKEKQKVWRWGGLPIADRGSSETKQTCRRLHNSPHPDMLQHVHKQTGNKQTNIQTNPTTNKQIKKQTNHQTNKSNNKQTHRRPHKSPHPDMLQHFHKQTKKINKQTNYQTTNKQIKKQTNHQTNKQTNQTTNKPAAGFTSHHTLTCYNMFSNKQTNQQTNKLRNKQTNKANNKQTCNRLLSSPHPDILQHVHKQQTNSKLTNQRTQ